MVFDANQISSDDNIIDERSSVSSLDKTVKLEEGKRQR